MFPLLNALFIKVSFKHLESEEMAKLLMICPFSNRMCMECGVYRGRHFYLCSVKGNHGGEWDIS